MGMPKGQQKRAREAAAPSFDTVLNAILSVEGESPTNKLIQASQLWSTEPASTASFFAKVRPYVESLTSSNKVPADEAEDELMELFQEYEGKTAETLIGEVDELKSAGVLSKKEAKALKQSGVEEQRRMLFVRILVIAMESEDGDEDAADGDESGEVGDGGADITEEFIDALTEADCVEKPQQEESAVVRDLAGWVCGLPTAELREMCEARGVDVEDLPADGRVGLVQGLLRGMLEAEAALDGESDEEEDEEEGESDDDIESEEEDEEEDDDDDEDDDEDDEDDDEEEDDDAPAKKAKRGDAGSSAGPDAKPGECKQQ